jgi:hypothetical protein
MYISLKSVRLVIERLFFFVGGVGLPNFLKKSSLCIKNLKECQLGSGFEVWQMCKYK